ncbi:MAG: DUF6624 domain-containing protein [Candidatus Limnocylindria bacterium]
MNRIRAALPLLALLLGACAAQPSARSAPPGSAAPTTTAPPSVAPSVDASHALADALNPALRDELLAMMAEDQAVRTGVAPPGDDRTADELFAAWDAVDFANQERMREILDEYGWPGWSLVGEDGALAAWILIQHSDLQRDLQKRGLAMLQAAVDADDADPGDLAYLIDRVRVADGEPQVYGTQVMMDESGELISRTPIEDEANVDARRAEVGLGTLEEYYEEFRNTVEAEPSTSPTP